MYREFCERLNIHEKTYAAVVNAEDALRDVFAHLDQIESINQMKVLQAFQDHAIAQRHFTPTTGYGYDDIGRDTLDQVFAQALGAEDALVRPHFVNGTHSLFLALAGILLPGDKMLSITGKPYDTLEEAIGISGNAPGSLKEQGIQYIEAALVDGKIDLEKVKQELQDPAIRVVYAQRSRGYSWRNALSIEDLGEAFSLVKRIRPDVVTMVDNCYGEFTQTKEPTAVGADVIMGSLIKNPGGGIAPTGGYIAGKAEYIERISHRLTVPGIGREVGSYAGSYVPFYQGLFMAPHVTIQSLKSASLFAMIFEQAGMKTLPGPKEDRSDIIQAVQFNSKEGLIAFCQSIQKASPVDSFVVPEPWDMPGYTDQVIMAAGAFVQGSSIELSADAPIREPYTAYVQGALTYSHGRIAALMALDRLYRAGEITL